jgi:hypothetical protein
MAADGIDSSISILTISLAKHLHGHSIKEGIIHEWSTKATSEQQKRFNNQGFDLDPVNSDKSLQDLRQTLQGTRYDGVITGWCTRGNKQFSPLFEKVVEELVAQNVRSAKNGDGHQLKLIFNDGPEDLVGATLRNFPMDD